MKRFLVILLVILLLSILYVQTYYDARCYDVFMSGSRITPLGVFCHRNRGNGHSTEFYRLEVLEATTPVPVEVTPSPSDNG